MRLPLVQQAVRLVQRMAAWRRGEALHAATNLQAPEEICAPPPPAAPPESLPALPPAWLPDWRKLIADEQELWNSKRQERKTRILVGTVAGGHPVCTALEGLVAAALTMHGAEVDLLLCDGGLPACLQCAADGFPSVEAFLNNGPKGSHCAGCYAAGREAYEPLGLDIKRLSEHITEEDRQSAQLFDNMSIEAMRAFKMDDLLIGENAHAGALRFFASGDLHEEPLGEEVLRQFMQTGLITKLACDRLLETGNYDILYMNHGIYVPHGILKDSAQARGIRCVIWGLATKASCIHMAHDDAVFDMLDEPVSVWENMHWSQAVETELMEYLNSRWNGSLDWMYAGMHAGSTTDSQQLSRELGIDFNKPTFGLLTNVIWDAALFYPAVAFPGMVEWMIETIHYFAAKPEYNLVIRVHPGEVRGTMPSRQTAAAEIAKVFPVLPPNIFFVPPQSSVNTYALMGLCDAALIYGTTTGIELTCMGVPTITAGQAFIKNKGISYDANNREEYFALLDKLPFGRRMSEEHRTRARMYAYNYYFRRSLPIKFAEPVRGWPPLKMHLQSLRQLLPGADRGIDVICQGILHLKPFVYPAEEFVRAKDEIAR